MQATVTRSSFVTKPGLNRDSVSLQKITGTRLQLTLFASILKTLREAGENVVPSGLPHAIIKVPAKTGRLKTHVDFREKSFADLCKCLREETTIEDWSNKYGRQTLLHIHCGTGSTLGFENLSLDAFRLLMCMLDPNDPFPIFSQLMTGETWVKKSEGPNFFEFENPVILSFLNSTLKYLCEEIPDSLECHPALAPELAAPELAAPELALGSESALGSELTTNCLAWCHTLPSDVTNPFKGNEFRKVRLVRLSGESSEPMLVCWPNGFPHGAHAESTSIRYTMTVPIIPGEHSKNLQRAKNRVKALYNQEDRSDEEHLQMDSGGLTHKHPEHIFDYFDKFSSFRALFPTDYQSLLTLLESL